MFEFVVSGSDCSMTITFDRILNVDRLVDSLSNAPLLLDRRGV